MNSEDRYDSLFLIYGDRYNVPWKLLKAQVKIESGFDPEALSPVGAEGLSQFMPATFAEWASKLKIRRPDVRNPEHAIKCQAAYMDWLVEELGTGEPALAAYNWGIGNFKKCLAAHPNDWRDHLPEETQQYVEKIQRQFAAYSEPKNG